MSIPSPSPTLSATIKNFLDHNDWRNIIKHLRAWYAANFPRWECDEIECRLGWVGTLFIIRKQLQERNGPPTDRHFSKLTKEEIDQNLMDEIHRHLNETLATYVRHCRRIDNETIPAETKVAETLKRIGIGA